MNVNNFEDAVDLPQDMLDDIFKHQHQLEVKYSPIEDQNGLLETKDMPVNIHDRMGQARIKSMFWRCTEELMEALEALDDKDFTHFYEEMADAMHFLVAACLLADFNPVVMLQDESNDSLSAMFYLSRVTQPHDTTVVAKEAVEEYMIGFIKKMGLSANCLKNKPWKQSHMLTDEKKFKGLLGQTFRAFIDLCKVTGFNSEGLYRMYMRKNQVNKFRQRSGY